VRYLLLILLLTGCAMGHGDDINIAIQLPPLEVHLVSAENMPYICEAYGVPRHCLGIAVPAEKRIYCIAHANQGHVDFNWYIMGHEIGHYLNWLNNEVINPHMR
jgi:hypothetical protein